MISLLLLYKIIYRLFILKVHLPLLIPVIFVMTYEMKIAALDFL